MTRTIRTLIDTLTHMGFTGLMSHLTPQTEATPPPSSSLTSTTGKEIGILLHIQEKSAADLARRLGISRNSMRRRLRGETPIDLNELQVIAGWLNVPIARLTDPAQALSGRLS